MVATGIESVREVSDTRDRVNDFLGLHNRATLLGLLRCCPETCSPTDAGCAFVRVPTARAAVALFVVFKALFALFTTLRGRRLLAIFVVAVGAGCGHGLGDL